MYVFLKKKTKKKEEEESMSLQIMATVPIDDNICLWCS